MFFCQETRLAVRFAGDTSNYGQQMWKMRPYFIPFLLLFLSSCIVLVSAQGSTGTSKQWQTLNGDAPLVIARGGFSGIFPDSSYYAYKTAVDTGLPNLHIWCDVQLTKDGAGICTSNVRLDNSSNIADVYKDKYSTYILDGAPVGGWFSIDFTLPELAAPVGLRQGIFSRANNFDDSHLPILTVDELVKRVKPPGLWLNIQHDRFFRQHNLSMKNFVISMSERVRPNYVSCPEVGFLRRIIRRFRTSQTKLVFRFLEAEDVEPSTKKKYALLLNNLTFVRTFAAGILVPKSYIWPADEDLYLKNHTSLVLDAHKVGLEVFAIDFSNDALFPHDYSYDPVYEYLSFVDNGNFSIDGVISDFPLTASAAIDCFSHVGKNEKKQVNLLIISSEGASGDYPGCTDKAYDKAVIDGVDVLGCPIQMSKDGVPFCLGSINLRDRTNAAESRFMNRTRSISELNVENGIFSYDLTWSEIQTLKPAINNPYADYSLFRNPRARNEGKFMQLSDFLAFAKNASSVSGILISIENAPYLADKQGLGVTESILDALSKAGYTEETSKKIMIKSSDSSLLLKFKRTKNCELVFLVAEDVSDIANSTIAKIKTFANSVIVSRRSVFPTDVGSFLTGETTVVRKLQAFNLAVYVQIFRNEFVSQAWDYLSDAYVEINTHVSSMGINGLITDFPATAARYKTNRCLGYKNVPPYMTPVEPGGLIQLLVNGSLPPAEGPSPILNDGDVVEHPLPPARLRPPTVDTGIGPTATNPTQANYGVPAVLVTSTILASITILAALVLHV